MILRHQKRVSVLPLDQLRALPRVPKVEYYGSGLCSVYFLWWQSRLLYIGQSNDTPYRVERHQLTKYFTHATWLILPEGRLRRFEQEYVLHYSPPLNRTRLG